MNEKFISEFKSECKKNREYLGYSFYDVSVSLVNVSEEEYKSFEESDYILSRENMERLTRVLCISKPNVFDVNKYIDTSDLSEEEVDDITKVVASIVGDLDV